MDEWWGQGHYVVPLGLALPLQDGGGVERRGSRQLLRGRPKVVRAGAGEESRPNVVHHGGEQQPALGGDGGGCWRSPRAQPSTVSPMNLRWLSAREGAAEWQII